MCACQPVPASSPTAASSPSSPVSPLPPAPWWNDAVFYEIFVRSFYDSDGNGVGDLPGLIDKLNYLNDGNPATTADLGVTGLWLMPVAQSPSYHGYDVADYTRVDDEYGTNADFKQLIAEAHRRGMRVIVDLVLNHTSREHPWFQESRRPNSPKRDWYLWAGQPLTPNGWRADDSGYYYGYFSPDMPDLNYRNPAVTAAMRDTARFWLVDMGADGFRLDAVKYLLEDGQVIENTPATHAWLRDFRPFYQGLKPDALTVGEIWSTTDVVKTYVGDQLDLAFEFDLAEATLQSAVSGRKVNVERAQQRVIAAYPAGQFATFLANHDQNRARSRLLNDEQAKVAATLQLTFPGVPFIYYGEEIGLQGVKPDEHIRRPLPWTSAGGFTTGQPWEDYFEDYPQRNITTQDKDPVSLLNHYRALIRLRQAHPALCAGDWLPIKTDHDSVYAFLRVHDDDLVLALVNLARQPVNTYQLTLPAGPLTATLQPALVLGQKSALKPPVVNAVGGFDAYQPVEILPPYSSFLIGLMPEK